MMNRSQRGISGFEELNLAKKKLKTEIQGQEEKILNNPLFSIPATLFQGGSVSGSLKSSIDSISFDQYKKAAISLLSTVLMSSKRTRKFFVAFIIAKEMIPFILEKVNENVKK